MNNNNDIDSNDNNIDDMIWIWKKTMINIITAITATSIYVNNNKIIVVTKTIIIWIIIKKYI